MTASYQISKTPRIQADFVIRHRQVVLCGPQGEIMSKRRPGAFETSLAISRVFSEIEFLDHTGSSHSSTQLRRPVQHNADWVRAPLQRFVQQELTAVPRYVVQRRAHRSGKQGRRANPEKRSWNFSLELRSCFDLGCHQRTWGRQEEQLLSVFAPLGRYASVLRDGPLVTKGRKGGHMYFRSARL